MNKLEIWFRETFCKWKTRHETAEFNNKGFYDPNKSYVIPCEVVFKGDGYLTVYDPPSICQDCGKTLDELKFYPVDIEGKEYYQTLVYQCPEGHGFYYWIM